MCVECMRGRFTLLGWVGRDIALDRVRDDYVMAGVYTRIYMALMGNISIF